MHEPFFLNLHGVIGCSMKKCVFVFNRVILYLLLPKCDPNKDLGYCGVLYSPKYVNVKMCLKSIENVCNLYRLIHSSHYKNIVNL